MPLRTSAFHSKKNTLHCTECGLTLEHCQCIDPDALAEKRVTDPVIRMLHTVVKRETFGDLNHVLLALGTLIKAELDEVSTDAQIYDLGIDALAELTAYVIGSTGSGEVSTN